MKTKRVSALATIIVAVLLPIICAAQVNSGSNGSDGAFNPTTNTVINMSDHPAGIYQYTSVNIPTNVTVTFIPNANNSPVTWLVQGSCVISGTVDISGQHGNDITSGQGGPGGCAGGAGGQGDSWLAHMGAGLGGGNAAQQGVNSIGGNGSYATVGQSWQQAAPGLTYGNKYLLPLLGGSGGGGGYISSGAGGGGAILIASDSTIIVDGSIVASGGGAGGNYGRGGGGSGGGIRLVAPQILGHGNLIAFGGPSITPAGDGFIRLDVLDDQFTGILYDSASRGFNPILIAPAQTASLSIQSIAGNTVPTNPTGVLFTPDASISSQQTNPIPIVVRCVNLPLGTPVTVVVKPVNGPMVLGSTANNAGTQISSTATVSIVMPRGGGLVYATAGTSN